MIRDFNLKLVGATGLASLVLAKLIAPSLDFDIVLSSVTGPPPTLEPSANWNGTAGSGFTTTPSDPTRSTAKPVVRLIEPPLQRFTDELIVGAMAFANNGGTLIGGIDRVRFSFDGPPIEVTTPTFRTLTREDGTTYPCLAYWVTLKKPAGIVGAANLYIEAVPADPTMQSRVMGPYTFYPQDTVHDLSVTVGASGDHADLASAMAAVSAASAQSGLITLLDDGDYAPGIVNYNPTQGYHKITAAEGVTARFIYPTGSEGEWRPQFGNIWFEGVSIDLISVFALRNNNDEIFVVKNCRLEKEGGPQLLYKNVWNNSHVVRNDGWFLENFFLGAHEAGASLNAGRGSTLRGNISQSGTDDFAEQPFLTAYNIVDDYNWGFYFDPNLGRLRVQYSGSGAVTYSRIDVNPGGLENRYTQHVLKVDGTAAVTFNAWRDWSRHDDGDNLYTVEDLANAINAVAGFTATVLPDDGSTVADRAGNAIAAHLINRASADGANNPNDFYEDQAIGSDYTFVCDIDRHEDGFANGVTSNGDNIIHVFNRFTRFPGQNFILNGSRDMVIAGNVFDQGQDAKTIGNSTLNDGADYSHCVIAHNSWRGQYIRVIDSPGWDGYCTFSNNAVLGIFDGDGVLTGANNIVAEGETNDAPGIATADGGPATWFPNRAAFDFSPAGELLDAANTAAPTLKFDSAGNQRPDPAPVGALA